MPQAIRCNPRTETNRMIASIQMSTWEGLSWLRNTLWIYKPPMNTGRGLAEAILMPQPGFGGRAQVPKTNYFDERLSASSIGLLPSISNWSRTSHWIFPSPEMRGHS